MHVYLHPLAMHLISNEVVGQAGFPCNARAPSSFRNAPPPVMGLRPRRPPSGLALLKLDHTSMTAAINFLGELDAWATVAVECQCPLRVDIEGIVRDNLHLAS
jgi:hypothetical protein